MLDYAAIEALSAVIRQGSFEKAARSLNVTSSAVSQRIKGLEEAVGKLLVVRSQPCRATEAGAALCRHAERVALLEHELKGDMPEIAALRGDDEAPTLRVAANADSVATWFVSALAPFAIKQGVLFDVSIDDQDHTATMLTNAMVQGAVTTLKAPVRGCRVVRLGTMRFLATCSPAFYEKHFPEGVNRNALRRAPCLLFNSKDALQRRFVRRLVGAALKAPMHWLPSPQGFVDACVQGMAWGMNPEALVRAPLEEGRLRELVPGRHLDVELYWQYWKGSSPLLDELTAAVQSVAARTLRP